MLHVGAERSSAFSLRGPRTTGERIRSCPPPELSLGLLLYLADSLTRHPRLGTIEVFGASPTAAVAQHAVLQHYDCPSKLKLMRAIVSLILAWLICHGIAVGQSASTNAPVSTNAPSKFRSVEDGWLDVSGFLDEKYGFLPDRKSVV